MQRTNFPICCMKEYQQIVVRRGLLSNQVQLNVLNLIEGLYLCAIEVNGQIVTERLMIK